MKSNLKELSKVQIEEEQTSETFLLGGFTWFHIRVLIISQTEQSFHVYTYCMYIYKTRVQKGECEINSANQELFKV